MPASLREGNQSCGLYPETSATGHGVLGTIDEGGRAVDVDLSRLDNSGGSLDGDWIWITLTEFLVVDMDAFDVPVPQLGQKFISVGVRQPVHGPQPTWVDESNLGNSPPLGMSFPKDRP